MVSWSSRKQLCVVLDTAEVEYVAACAASREAVWLQKLLPGLFDIAMEATCILCDNQSCIKLSENLMFHDRLNHNKIMYHYIGDMVQKGAVRLQFRDYKASKRNLSKTRTTFCINIL
jgi:KUP system potassium uptake protein